MDSGLGLKLGIHVWSSSYEIQVEDSGLVFQFGILVSESGLGSRVSDSGLRFRIDYQVWNKIWDSGLGLRFWIQVCHLCLGFSFKGQVWGTG